MENRIKTGDIVKHFKRGTRENDSAYLYKVMGFATHTETKERLVVYQALYSDYGIYCRPFDMFMDEVDKEKYPNVEQKYRFEVVNGIKNRQE